jgi:hypothetical protein
MNINGLLELAYDTYTKAAYYFTTNRDKLDILVVCSYMHTSISSTIQQKIIIEQRKRPESKDLINLLQEAKIDDCEKIYKVAKSLDSGKEDFTNEEVAEMLQQLHEFLISVSPLYMEYPEFLKIYFSIPESTRQFYGDTPEIQVHNYIQKHPEEILHSQQD